jgi:hypothetical protein
VNLAGRGANRQAAGTAARRAAEKEWCLNYLL